MSVTSPAMCQKINGQNGLKRRSSQTTLENVADICKLKAKDCTIKEIAKKLNLTIWQVEYTILKHSDIIGTYRTGKIARSMMLVAVKRQTREKINPEIATKLLDIIARDDMIDAILDGE